MKDKLNIDTKQLGTENISMSTDDNRRKGQERHDPGRLSFSIALDEYKKAPPEKKATCALAVLSNAAALNMKLGELINDSELTKAIRRDAGL